eukprot:g6848.t1
MSAFKQVPNHRMPLDREAFAASLKQAEIKLSEEETLAIFDLLDVRRWWSRSVNSLPYYSVQDPKDIAPIQSGLQELKQGIRVALKEAKEVELEAQGLRFTKIGRSLGFLVLLPFLMFISLLVLCSFTFRSFPGLTWSLALLYLCVSLLFMVVRQSRDGPRFWFHAGSLCFIATVLACACGLWNYSRNIYKYWAYEGQSSYSDLAASDRATSFLDAGKLAFRDDVIVDFEHATGYREGTELLCVAPLVSKAATQGTVEFWAAGRRCCEDGDFNCGDAKRGAKAGLVFLEERRMHFLSHSS